MTSFPLEHTIPYAKNAVPNASHIKILINSL